jgi:Ca2+-transporting ATPase
VVGDIVDLHQGDRVPADCILVEEMSIAVDETIYFSKQTKVAKSISQTDNMGNDNHQQHPTLSFSRIPRS